MDDDGLEALHVCSSLTRLDVEEVAGITPAGVHGLLHAVTRLVCMRLSSHGFERRWPEEWKTVLEDHVDVVFS